jgi:spore photoproduct lyase
MKRSLKITDSTLDDKHSPIPHYRDGKSIVKIVPKKGTVFDTCATIGKEFVCCNVKVLKAVSNCPFDCSYCFLQNYLNDGTTKVIGDISGMMAEVDDQLIAEPNRFFRIGTWELGDSLALEAHVGQANALIREFAKRNNVVLELKTKSDCVDGILEVDHQGKTVVSWSINTEFIVNSEEHRTASLANRIRAMEKVIKAGYLVGLHFDPMIVHEGWKDGYSKAIDDIFSVVPPDRIAWISIGSLRFNPEQKEKMDENFPRQTLTSSEMVLAPDNKIRYVKPLRVTMYQHLYRCLLTACGVDTLSACAPPIPNRPVLYFCMERDDIYNKVIGNSPKTIQELDYLFALNAYTRFRISGMTAPKTAYY